jgi:hypothetical protein
MIKVEVDRRILSKLMLEPTGRVRTNLLTVVRVCRTGNCLAIRFRESLVAEPLERWFNPGLAVEIVHFGEEVDPLLPVSQKLHGWRLVDNDPVNCGGMTTEDFQGDDGSRAGAEHCCRLVAQMLDQASNVIGVDLKPMGVVLRSIQLAPRKPTSIVNNDRVACCQIIRRPFERSTRTASTSDHEHE